MYTNNIGAVRLPYGLELISAHEIVGKRQIMHVLLSIFLFESEALNAPII